VSRGGLAGRRRPTSPYPPVIRHFAVTAIGRDRPGIVAAVTRNLLEHHLNVEDSQMTILRGHFTMMLVVSGAAEVEARALRADLERTAAQLDLEAVSLDEVTEAGAADASTPTHIVTVYGTDHQGIVHAVAAALADCGVNITDLNTRLVGDIPSGDRNGDGGEGLYAMMVEVAMPSGLSAKGLESLLEATKREQGVEITIRELEQDVL
jgi:glycine cleavage system transcriptional repressor